MFLFLNYLANQCKLYPMLTSEKRASIETFHSQMYSLNRNYSEATGLGRGSIR